MARRVDKKIHLPRRGRSRVRGGVEEAEEDC